MILERYLAEALTSYFGHVVDGPDQNKVRLSVWKGELAFQDLSIKKDAIPSDFVEIAYGRIGRLHVKFPWQLVRQQLWRARTDGLADSLGMEPGLPCQVVLSDINILIVRKRRRSGSMKCDESEAQYLNKGKGTSQHTQDWIDREAEIQKGLDSFLLQRRFDLQHQKQRSGNSWRDTLKKQLLNALLSNLVVSVQNIHIRFEDKGSSVGLEFGHVPDTTASRYRPPFAIGIQLKQFTVRSLDIKPEEQTTPVPPDQSECVSSVLSPTASKHQALGRIVHAESLAAYWDSDCRSLMVEQADHALYQFLFETLNSTGCSDCGLSRGHSFVLGPFSPTLEYSISGLAADLDVSESESASDAESTLKSPHDRQQRAWKEGNMGIASTSRVVLSLPPCHICLSRNLLEDLGYLRLLYSMSRTSRQHVSHLVMNMRRPCLAPKEDPRGWWQYAIEAVVSIQKSLEPVGWACLAKAISKRARYIALYKVLLSEADQPDKIQSRIIAHSSLLDMERNVLKISEIVAFRLTVYQTLYRGPVIGELPNLTLLVDAPVALKGRSILSLEHRLSMFSEFSTALQVDNRSGACDACNDEKKVNVPNSDVAWDFFMSCYEFSLQVNDRDGPSLGSRETATSEGAAVARLSCALAIRHKSFRDGSWQLSNHIGSLNVQDCTVSQGNASFPNLLCNKTTSRPKTMQIDGLSLNESVSVTVSREYSHDATLGIVTTTTTRIRVLPMEITLSTAPTEALLRILSTANMELTDDYHRVVSRLSEWRERQRVRLVRALAHKKKKIVLDVEIGAPVFLVPEESSVDSPLLILDLGRILFHNEDRKQTGKSCEFDDAWCLRVKQVQVQCSRTSQYRQILPDQQERNVSSSILPIFEHQLIEPFSLEFSIATKFVSEGDGRHRQASVSVEASLSRLVLNVTSSAMRLTKGLQIQWQKRRRLHQPHLLPRTHQTLPLTVGPEPSRSDRKIDFQFVAPLLKCRFENDVDGRDCHHSDMGLVVGTTPLIDLAVTGIEGRVLRDSQVNGLTSFSWTARMRSLYAFDLYQGAGDSFSFFLSSVCPDLLIGRTPIDVLSLDAKTPSSDLVSFDFESLSRSAINEADMQRESKFLVKFNELYVEWNPGNTHCGCCRLFPLTLSRTLHPSCLAETIAALHKAAKLPTDVLPKDDPSLDDERFIDAEEDEYFDALQTESVDGRRSLVASTDLSGNLEGVYSRVNRDQGPSSLHFELSRLRVHLNKETRHRRLLIVEMDNTKIYRRVETSGKSRTWATLGNLTASDADYSLNKTLYREILGLKTDSSNQTGAQSSLLEMEVLVNPKSRTLGVGNVQSYDGEVVIDVVAQTASGYDSFIKARFSPMRFVYIQQVWFEIVDYFFEGIVGYEVWGKLRPAFGPLHDVTQDPPNADRINFTKFVSCKALTLDRGPIIPR